MKIKRPKSMSRATWFAGLVNGQISSMRAGEVCYHGLWTWTRIGDTAYVYPPPPEWRKSSLTPAGRAVAQLIEAEQLRITSKGGR